MPFTLSHPAAAIPFVRYGLSLSALIVGSMAPDFPYFIHLSTGFQYGHTLKGIFLFCIPAGLVALWLFHKFLKFPLLSLLPVAHQTRLISVADEFRFAPARRFLLIILALVIGAFTHIAWDSFTHANGWAVQNLAALRLPILETSQSTLFVFKVLQHGSTLLGAAFLVFYYFRWFKQAAMQQVVPPVQLSERLKLRLIIFMALLGFLLSGIYSFAANAAYVGANKFPMIARDFVIAGVVISCVELIIFSSVWHLKASQEK